VFGFLQSVFESTLNNLSFEVVSALSYSWNTFCVLCASRR